MDVRIARQGLALRRSNIRAQEALSFKLPKHNNESLAPNVRSTSNASLVTLLEGVSPDSIFSPDKRALERRDTAATSPEPEDEITELLDELRKRRPEPVSFSEDGEYVERLLAEVGEDVRCLPASSKVSSFVQGSFMPYRIPPPHQRQLNVFDSQLRRWGASSWFYPKQLEGLEAKTYHEATLAVQRRLIKEALEPDIILHFPDWKPFRMGGRGRYRVATELPDNKVTRNLLTCMGGLADVIGGVGSGVPIEGHDGLDFHSLLCIKYAKEIDRRMRPPREEIVDGVLVVRGFPLDFKKKMDTAEVFLAPLTYEAFDFLQPHGQISEHRLVQYHYWTGKDVAEENPDQYTLENTYQCPKPKHDWGNLPYHVKFTNPAEPSHILRPGRHSCLQDSELEALEARNEPPQPDAVTVRANALLAQARANVIANAKPRPAVVRRSSDKTKKVRAAPVLLGHKRVVSREKQLKDKGIEEKDHALAQEGIPSKDQAAAKAGPPLGSSLIAQQLHQLSQAQGQSPHAQNQECQANRPANSNENGIAQSSKGSQAPDAASSSTSSAQCKKTADQKEDLEAANSSPDSILDYYLHSHHSNPPDDEWTDIQNGQEASPALQSILINQADPHQGSPNRSEKRSVNWADDPPCPRTQSIDIPRTPVSTLNHLRGPDPFADDYLPPSPSMALAIRDIEARRHSGTLRPRSSPRTVSPVVEMAKLQLEHKEQRIAAATAAAANAKAKALDDYGTALGVLKEVVEEHG
ncbi:MAG: hypothetical protein Q9195_003904 [Heterodermia aff. obscurata]